MIKWSSCLSVYEKKKSEKKPESDFFSPSKRFCFQEYIPSISTLTSNRQYGKNHFLQM